MTVLWPSGGHQKDEGKEADPKLLGGEWLNWNGTVQAGTHGTPHAMLLQTDLSGEMMSEPCVPSGTGRIKVKVYFVMLN